ncbi:hypothetical protein Nhal_1923 [Nitrosococcus halophilus Nc 4]|uniref:Uncharacterized protein n=1 Tax=Nitrosococcus halophilus (strain Nc4) TaxID=472759 RepID=D5C3Q9_NITHN|nr:hypothetical protein Nhal_1923 [Nitrosococcus halophilus Nc 4]
MNGTEALDTSLLGVLLMIDSSYRPARSVQEGC